MEWLSQNWIWILLGAWFVAVIVFGDATRKHDDTEADAGHGKADHERAIDALHPPGQRDRPGEAKH